MITLGANAQSQGIAFVIMLAIGFASGVVALAYFTKSRPFERILIDFVSTIAIGGIFILSTEFIMGGKIEIYSILAYALGVPIIPAIYKRLRAKRRKEKQQK